MLTQAVTATYFTPGEQLRHAAGLGMRSAHRTKGSVNKPISMHTDPPPQPSSLTCVAAAFAERAQARTFAARAQAAIQRRHA